MMIRVSGPPRTSGQPMMCPGWLMKAWNNGTSGRPDLDVRVTWRFGRRRILRLQVAFLIEQPGIHDLPHHRACHAATGLAVLNHHRDHDFRVFSRREANEQGVVTMALKGLVTVVALTLLDCHHLR